MNPILIVLAISLAANAGLTWVYLDTRDEVTEQRELKNQALDTAQKCSDSVKDLQTQAIERANAASKAIAEAESKAKTRNQSADRILSTPASTPGNDCKSAQDRVADWLKGRQ